MTRRTTLILLGFLVCFFVGQAPARLVGVLLPERLALDAVSGSLWTGKAARGVFQLDGGSLILGRVSWQYRPLSFVLLQPTITISVDWGGQQLAGAVTRKLAGTVVVRDFYASFDSGLVRQFLPLYIGGRVIADFSEIAIASNQVLSLEGELVWEGAVWAAAAGDVPLGDYQLVVSDNKDALQGRVTTLSGALIAAGDVVVAASNYKIDLDLSGPATRDPELANALQLLAVPSATGFDMVIEGRL